MKKIVKSCLLIILFIGINTVINCSSSHISENEIVAEPKSVVQLRSVQPNERKLVLGREYYYALLDKGTIRHWAVPFAFHFQYTDKFFNDCGRVVDNAVGLIGSPVSLRDIYLVSRLADNNLMSRICEQPPTKARPVGQTTPIYGAFANEIYLTLLAPVQVSFTGVQQKEASFVLSGIYRFGLTECNELEMAIGVQVPVKTRIHDQGLQFINGSLFTAGRADILAPETNSLTEFFHDYTGLEDFFLREVLGPQGLTFSPHIVKTGIADVSLFALVDFAGYFNWVDGLQLGVNFVFPTGQRACNTLLFDPCLGDGVYSFEPFFNGIFSSCSKWFNPSFRIVGQVSAQRKFCCADGGFRIPTGVSVSGVVDPDCPTPAGRARLQNVPGLRFPQFFRDYFIGPFSNALDSTIPAFAGVVPQVCYKKGSRFLFGIGDYIYDIFAQGFRVGLFYDYAYKKRDTITVPCQGLFDVCAATAGTETRSHSIGVNITYKFRNLFEVNFGSQNVVAGRNVPRTHEFFASLITVF